MPSPSKRKQGSSEKWLVPALLQGLEVPESKNVLGKENTRADSEGVESGRHRGQLKGSPAAKPGKLRAKAK